MVYYCRLYLYIYRAWTQRVAVAMRTNYVALVNHVVWLCWGTLSAPTSTSPGNGSTPQSCPWYTHTPHRLKPWPGVLVALSIWERIVPIGHGLRQWYTRWLFYSWNLRSSNYWILNIYIFILLSSFQTMFFKVKISMEEFEKNNTREKKSALKKNKIRNMTNTREILFIYLLFRKHLNPFRLLWRMSSTGQSSQQWQVRFVVVM